jgi:hypothetical protein
MEFSIAFALGERAVKSHRLTQVADYRNLLGVQKLVLHE